jgi:Domain of unknown function (DUF4333)
MFPRMPSRGFVLVGLACACLLPLSGCGKKVVSQKTVETQVATELQHEVKATATPKVVCPGDLEAKVGATMMCTLTPAGSTTTYPVTVTVESLTNGVAHFDAKVGTANP